MVERRRALAALSPRDDEAQDSDTSMEASDCVPLARFGYHRLMPVPPASTPPSLEHLHKVLHNFDLVSALLLQAQGADYARLVLVQLAQGVESHRVGGAREQRLTTVAALVLQEVRERFHVHPDVQQTLAQVSLLPTVVETQERIATVTTLEEGLHGGSGEDLHGPEHEVLLLLLLVIEQELRIFPSLLQLRPRT